MSGSGKEIFDVFPTPMAKQLMKTRQATAQKGHDILKRKGEVLEMKFRKVAEEIIKAKKDIGAAFQDASIKMAEARYVSGDFNQMVLNGGVEEARLKVVDKTENVAGVKLTGFKMTKAGKDSFSLTGLAKGGEKIQTVKEIYAHITELLVKLAGLQMNFKILDENIKSIKRRVNSLEHSYIPKCQRTMKYIVEEMDDRERQDFYRLKKIKDIKKRIAEEKANEKGEREGTGGDLDDADGEDGLIKDLTDKYVSDEDLDEILKDIGEKID